MTDGTQSVLCEVKSVEVLATPVSNGAHAPSLQSTEPLLPSAGNLPFGVGESREPKGVHSIRKKKVAHRESHSNSWLQEYILGAPANH